MPSSTIVVPDSVRESAEKSLGAFFERISKTPAGAGADDHLNIEKSFKRAQLLERYTSMRGKKATGDRLRIRDQSGDLDQIVCRRRVRHGTGWRGLRKFIRRIA